METVKFNINNNVRIRLTPYGQKVAPGLKPDKDGWVKMQLWVVMAELGPHLSLGMNHVAFETEIELITKE